jgi:hypothetical protein
MQAMGPLVMPEEDSAVWWASAYVEATTGKTVSVGAILA